MQNILQIQICQLILSKQNSFFRLCRRRETNEKKRSREQHKKMFISMYWCFFYRVPCRNQRWLMPRLNRRYSLATNALCLPLFRYKIMFSQCARSTAPALRYSSPHTWIIHHIRTRMFKCVSQRSVYVTEERKMSTESIKESAKNDNSIASTFMCTDFFNGQNEQLSL